VLSLNRNNLNLKTKTKTMRMNIRKLTEKLYEIGRKLENYEKSLLSSSVTGALLGITEGIFTPWRYFPKIKTTIPYINLHIHAYDILFTWPIYTLGASLPYIRERKVFKNLKYILSNIWFSMVIEEVVFFLLNKRLPSPTDVTSSTGYIPLGEYCIPIWWIIYSSLPIYFYFRRKKKEH
jgi:hypothetical protein